MTKGIRCSFNGVFICAAIAIAATGAAMLGDFSPASPRQNFPTPKPAFSRLPGAVNPPAGVAASPASKLVASYGKLPLGFEANEGQTDGRVKFLAHGRGYALFLTGDEAVLKLGSPSQKSNRKSQKTKVESRNSKFETRNSKSRRANVAPDFSPARADLKVGATTTDSVLRMRLVGANANAAVVGAEELPGKSNYFIGNDPKKWRTNVPNYAQVRYQNVYPGVDLVYYGNQGGQLEYDFVVAPGANPSAISFAIDAAGQAGSRQKAVGSGQYKIDSNGDLLVKTDGGELVFHKPLVYQEAECEVRGPSSGVEDETGNSKLEIQNSGNHQSPIVNRQLLDGQYALDAQNQVHFALGPYDKSKPLVIDPVLSYSTYLGGSSGNYFAVDRGLGIAVDSSGSAYVTGSTTSANFPTANPLQGSLEAAPGGGNAFVTKLNSTGSALVYSTYLGGNGLADDGYGIAVDSFGDAYVAGWTRSTNFPTVNPIQASPKSSWGTAFVAELNSTGSALVYSTYLGGSGNPAYYEGDVARGIAVDSSGNAYVTGYTYSTDFPTIPINQNFSIGGASNSAGLGGIQNAFVSKLSPNGTALVYSTYLGGNFVDGAAGIAVDSSGNAYVTGNTVSGNFPTANPFQASLPNSNESAFVAELNATASALVYSTYLGGSTSEQGNGIAVDSSGNAYVTGTTGSTDFPTAPQPPAGNPLQASLGGGDNSFVTKLNWAASTSTLSLVYSTYLGGSIDDYGNAIAVDSSGNAYVAGETDSPDFPTVNPLYPTCAACPNEGYDAFVAELNVTGTALVYSTYLGGSSDDFGYGIAVDSNFNAYVTGSTQSSDYPTTANSYQRSLGGPGAINAFVAKFAPDTPAGSNITVTETVPGGPTVTLTFSNVTQAGNTTVVASPACSAATPGGFSVGISGNMDCVDVSTTAMFTGNVTITISFNPAGFSSGATLDLLHDVAGSWVPVASTVNNGSTNTIMGTVTSFSPFGVFQSMGATLESIAVTPASPSIAEGLTQQFTATGTYSDGSTQNLTSQVTWNSATTSVATIAAGGLATGVGTGTSNITASLNGVTSPPDVLTVTAGAATHLAVSAPATATAGTAFNFTVTALDQFNNTASGYTGMVHFTSADSQASLPANSMLTNGVGTFSATLNTVGSQTITATDTVTSSITGTSNTITVTAAMLGPVASVSPSSINFGTVNLGTITVKSVTVTNEGTAPMMITDPFISILSGGDPKEFVAVNLCPKSLAAGKSCRIDVGFVAGPNYTLQTATLSVMDNAAGSPQTVALSATVIKPKPGTH